MVAARPVAVERAVDHPVERRLIERLLAVGLAALLDLALDRLHERIARDALLLGDVGDRLPLAERAAQGVGRERQLLGDPVEGPVELGGGWRAGLARRRRAVEGADVARADGLDA